MMIWTLCCIAGGAVQYISSRLFGSGFWWKLLMPALIILCALLTGNEDVFFACLCMLSGMIAGACIYWIGLSFES